MTDQNIQRALGRIEGTMDQILAKLDRLEERFGDHTNDDQKNFSAVRALFFEKLKESHDAREQHLSEQDKKLDDLKADYDRARGAGWAIIGLLGSFATFIGAALIAVMRGWVDLKFH